MPGTTPEDSTAASATVFQGAVRSARLWRPAAQELPSFPVIPAAVKAAVSAKGGLCSDA